MSTPPRRITARPSSLHDPVVRPFDPPALAIMDAPGIRYAEAGGFAILAAQDILYTRHFGTDASDTMTGTAAHEVFHMQQGGEDVVDGGAGDDGFYFGAAWSAGDKVNGGAGNDQLGLKGNYGQLSFGANSMRGIETLVLLSGQQTDFGTSGDEYHSYRLKTHDSNIAGGERLIVNMNTLQREETIEFDGSAETDGSFLFYGGHGDEVLRGGKQSDGFYFGQRYGSGETAFDPDRDVLHGGGGDNDQLGLQGSYILTLTGRILDSIETVVLLSHTDTRFGGSGSGPNLYTLSFRDSNNPAYRPDRITINGNTLAADENLSVFGFEMEHTAFTVYGGQAADVIQGGHRNDILSGGAGDDMLSGYIGADRMTGGAGRDVFAIIGAEDSSGVAHDVITDFDAASDYLSINNESFTRAADVRGVAIARGSFDTDLTNAVAGKLEAGGILLAQAGQGDYAGSVFVVADMNGVAGYQAGEDVVVELLNPVNFAATGTDWIYSVPDL